ncbi:MAG: NAD-dependent epimerase/dehydratase family protein [Candidatus Ryanbacteria bacterium]|nr:NAD-dependent epimerase/dehydratase family protein [Candidatus Ryanbacteria bacterium]
MTLGYWQHKNVFITGATGLLGSWLVKYLVDAGARVTVLVRDMVPDSHLLTSGYINRVNVVRGSLESYHILERALNEYEIDTVFHAAAQTIVQIANRNPLPTLEANVRGTWNILEAVRRNPNVKKIIIASSDKAYGIHKELPYTEDAPLRGSHPYDVSKSAADLIAQMYHSTYGVPVTITRCGNFFGPGDLNFNRIVPETIRAFASNQRPIIRSDGTFIRDYFYIEDAADAYITLAEKMDDQKIHGHAFNFSNELQMSVREVVERIGTLMGSNLEPIIANEARNEIPHQYLSAQKAREMLGWSPRLGFDEGLRRTIDWYRKFLHTKGNV